MDKCVFVLLGKRLHDALSMFECGSIVHIHLLYTISSTWYFLPTVLRRTIRHVAQMSLLPTIVPHRVHANPSDLAS